MLQDVSADAAEMKLLEQRDKKSLQHLHDNRVIL